MGIGIESSFRTRIGMGGTDIIISITNTLICILISFSALLISNISITCEAMLFRVTEDGIIEADTLCEFTEKPSVATRLVGDKHKVGLAYRNPVASCTRHKLSL